MSSDIYTLDKHFHPDVCFVSLTQTPYLFPLYYKQKKQMELEWEYFLRLIIDYIFFICKEENNQRVDTNTTIHPLSMPTTLNICINKINNPFLNFHSILIFRNRNTKFWHEIMLNFCFNFYLKYLFWKHSFRQLHY